MRHSVYTVYPRLDYKEETLICSQFQKNYMWNLQ